MGKSHNMIIQPTKLDRPKIKEHTNGVNAKRNKTIKTEDANMNGRGQEIFQLKKQNLKLKKKKLPIRRDCCNFRTWERNRHRARHRRQRQRRCRREKREKGVRREG